VLHGGLPDHVPVCPDISNMVPARLTGKPYWDIYVYQDPPLWKAYIDAVKYFGIDGGFEMYTFGNMFNDLPRWEYRIVKRFDDGGFVTQKFFIDQQKWAPYVDVHTADKPPAEFVKPSNMGLPPIPEKWEPVEGVKQWPEGLELWKHIKNELGDNGIIGMPSGMKTCLLSTEDDVYSFYDNPAPFYAEAGKMLERVRNRLEIIKGLDEKPDFLFCGASGTLVMQTPEIFRELVLPVLKETTKLAKKLNIPTHLHSCGPEKELVKIAAEETDLTIIDPLEIPPMGDCNIKELKELYGDKIILKGNLHTTEVMLRGTVADVVRECKKVIDDAGRGGGFILSTGDQCGRDTPDENIRAMVETAADYGRY
jgi:uroporphyrinogen decarboxylase